MDAPYPLSRLQLREASEASLSPSPTTALRSMDWSEHSHSKRGSRSPAPWLDSETSSGTASPLPGARRHSIAAVGSGEKWRAGVTKVMVDEKMRARHEPDGSLHTAMLFRAIAKAAKAQKGSLEPEDATPGVGSYIGQEFDHPGKRRSAAWGFGKDGRKCIAHPAEEEVNRPAHYEGPVSTLTHKGGTMGRTKRTLDYGGRKSYSEGFIHESGYSSLRTTNTLPIAPPVTRPRPRNRRRSYLCEDGIVRKEPAPPRPMARESPRGSETRSQAQHRSPAPLAQQRSSATNQSSKTIKEQVVDLIEKEKEYGDDPASRKLRCLQEDLKQLKDFETDSLSLELSSNIARLSAERERLEERRRSSIAPDAVPFVLATARSHGAKHGLSGDTGALADRHGAGSQSARAVAPATKSSSPQSAARRHSTPAHVADTRAPAAAPAPAPSARTVQTRSHPRTTPSDERQPPVPSTSTPSIAPAQQRRSRGESARSQKPSQPTEEQVGGAGRSSSVPTNPRYRRRAKSDLLHADTFLDPPGFRGQLTDNPFVPTGASAEEALRYTRSPSAARVARAPAPLENKYIPAAALRVAADVMSGSLKYDMKYHNRLVEEQNRATAAAEARAEAHVERGRAGGAIMGMPVVDETPVTGPWVVPGWA